MPGPGPVTSFVRDNCRRPATYVIPDQIALGAVVQARDLTLDE